MPTCACIVDKEGRRNSRHAANDKSVLVLISSGSAIAFLHAPITVVWCYHITTSGALSKAKLPIIVVMIGPTAKRSEDTRMLSTLRYRLMDVRAWLTFFKQNQRL